MMSKTLIVYLLLIYHAGVSLSHMYSLLLQDSAIMPYYAHKFDFLWSFITRGCELTARAEALKGPCGLLSCLAGG